MSLSFLLVLGLAGLWLVWRGNAGVRAAEALAEDGDGSTLDALARAGSNLASVHRIEFYLYFPTRASADAAAAQLRQETFAVEVTPAESSEDWLCLATLPMRPELAPLRAWRERMTALAEAGGGAYDGWGTEVEDGRDLA